MSAPLTTQEAREAVNETWELGPHWTRAERDARLDTLIAAVRAEEQAQREKLVTALKAMRNAFDMETADVMATTDPVGAIALCRAALAGEPK